MKRPSSARPPRAVAPRVLHVRKLGLCSPPLPCTGRTLNLPFLVEDLPVARCIGTARPRRPVRAGRGPAARPRRPRLPADGNKLTAWPATATSPALNGVDLAGVDQDVAYPPVVDVASGMEAEAGRIAGRLGEL